MLRKFLLIGLFTLCATLYAYGPEWSSVGAQSPNQSIPDTANAGDTPTLPEPGDSLDNISQGNFAPGEPVVLNVNYTNDTGGPLNTPTFSVSLPEGVTPEEGSGWVAAGVGPDGLPVYTFESDNDLSNGESESIPLPVDISGDASATDPLNVPVRLDVYRPNEEPGNRLAVLIDTIEVLPAPVALPDDFSFTTGVVTETEIIAFTPDVGSIAPTVEDNAVQLAVDITPQEDVTEGQIVVSIPDGTELAPNSGWAEQIIQDADGNDIRVAVLNVGSLEGGVPVSVPFPLVGENIQPGTTLTAETFFSATAGSGANISLAGTIDR